MAQSGKNKTALIGPVAPYRGGIAQYTEQLYKALSKVSDTTVYSFKRQYPGWLYPGESDMDPQNANWNPDIRYTLDAISPLSWRRTADEIIKSGCTVAIINWWTLFWQPAFTLITRRLKKHGVKTIFLCHNISDHDEKGLQATISTRLLKTADAYIVHAKEEAKRLRDIKPDAVIFQRLHPIYTHFPKSTEKLKSRGDLELLFFGFIRPYKGLDVLLEAMQKLDNPNIHLTIAGEVWKAKTELEQKIAELNMPNIEYRFAYTSDEEAAEYFDRADVVVLPYTSATGSGVATLAFNYGKPIIASKVGGLQDVAIPAKTGWLVKPNSADDLAKTIKAIDRKKAKQLNKSIQKFCKDNSWEQMGKEVSRFCQKIAR